MPTQTNGTIHVSFSVTGCSRNSVAETQPQEHYDHIASETPTAALSDGSLGGLKYRPERLVAEENSYSEATVVAAAAGVVVVILLFLLLLLLLNLLIMTVIIIIIIIINTRKP